MYRNLVVGGHEIFPLSQIVSVGKIEDIEEGVEGADNCYFKVFYGPLGDFTHMEYESEEEAEAQREALLQKLDHYYDNHYEIRDMVSFTKPEISFP